MIECPKCGYLNADGSEFCKNPTNCGAFLGYEAKHVDPLPGTVQLSVSAAALTVAPGSVTTLEVRVRNKSTIVDQYQIEVVGDPASWSVVQPSTVSLFPDKEGTAMVQFRPPRAASVSAGRKPFAIKVQSKASPQISAVQDSSIEVAPYQEVATSIAPRTARGGAGASYRVLVQNKGNAPLDLALEAADPDELLTFEFDRPALTLGPGQAENLQLQVRPRAPFYDGPPQPHSFKVQLAAAGSPVAAADATFLQDPVPRPVPRKFPLVPVLLGLLLIGLLSAAAIERDPLMKLLGVASASQAPATGGQASQTASPAASTTVSTSATSSATTAPTITLVTVPNVTCASQQSAQQTLSNAGLVFVPNFSPSNAYPSGIVTRTQPAAGTSVAKGSEVTAFVSTGSASATGIRQLDPCLLIRLSPLPTAP